ncbi:MAG: hypothetical protein PHW39_02915 [Syntrophomonadaceae bacterium]|jgi:hypothetical protein|nr:hypothetical protein [Clostridia bacterium]MDD4562013.1 hypothetical protein [Syntrophomonadaceae bacterium]
MNNLIEVVNNENASLSAVVPVVTVENKANEYMAAAKSANTIKAYRKDWPRR